MKKHTALKCKGCTRDFDPRRPGSFPGRAAKKEFVYVYSMVLANIYFDISIRSIALIFTLYEEFVGYWPSNFFSKIKERWDKIRTWYLNRKEDKLFYKNHVDDRLERLGIKFDEENE